MRRFFRNWMVLILVFLTFLIVWSEISLAQQYMNFVGEVVNIYRKTIAVKSDKGEVMVFAVGRRTVYIPHRLPGVGEKVEVTYLLRRGYNVAYQVKILPPPPQKK